MSYNDPTYVIFDGDEDKWAYAYMKGWRENERVNFDFRDAHDLDSMTSRAQGEEYVKRNLRARMSQSKAVVVVVGEKTKNLFRFVRWEIDLALELGLPIIVVNLNNRYKLDEARCPPILRNKCAVHVPFKLKAIKHALDNFTSEFARFSAQERAGGDRYYDATVYQGMGIQIQNGLAV